MIDMHPRHIALSIALALPLHLPCPAQADSALTLVDVHETGRDQPASAASALSDPYLSQTSNRVIVRYRSGARSAASGRITRTIDTLGESSGIDAKFVRMTSDGSTLLRFNEPRTLGELHALAKEIESDPDVLYAEPDVILHPFAVPTDPRYNEQWHYFEAQGGINLPAAWDVASGEGVIVGVIDSGIRYHDDLAGQIVGGYDFISEPFESADGDGWDPDPTDPGNWADEGQCGYGSRANPSNWHGTHVAGTVAAGTDNGIGTAGVAWNARILAVRVLGKCGGSMMDIADAMRWAAGLPVEGVKDNPNPAKVLNLSLGGRGPCSRYLAEAIDAVRSEGGTVVAAAGNEAEEAMHFQPANCPGVITVAATRRDGGQAHYSNYGAGVDVAAPGGETFDPDTWEETTIDGVLSTVNSGRTTPGTDDHYSHFQGTSMAAPHVTGVAALLLSANPELTPDRIRDILVSTARPFPTEAGRPCDRERCGAGIIDAAAAVARADSGDLIHLPRAEDTFENTSDVEIADADYTGATSVIEVNRAGDTGTIQVTLDIRHPNASQLYAVLVSPDGEHVVLEGFTAQGTDIRKTYRIDATGIPPEGAWTLKVVDGMPGNAGYIDGWKLRFLQSADAADSAANAGQSKMRHRESWGDPRV